MKRDLRWLYVLNIAPFCVCSLLYTCANYILLFFPIEWIVLGIVNYHNTSTFKKMLSLDLTMLVSSVANIIIAIALFFSSYIYYGIVAVILTIALSLFNIIFVAIMIVIFAALYASNEKNLNRRWENVKKRARTGQ